MPPAGDARPGAEGKRKRRARSRFETVGDRIGRYALLSIDRGALCFFFLSRPVIGWVGKRGNEAAAAAGQRPRPTSRSIEGRGS